LRTAVEGGAVTAWFVRLGRVLAGLRSEQATRTAELPWAVWDEWLRESGLSGVRRAVQRCRTEITGTHDQQAVALETLGRMAGVLSYRPRGQSVTDAVWEWSSDRRVERRLWEVKTGGAGRISRDWVNQALGQIAEILPRSQLRVVGCIVSHLDEVDDDAARAAAEQLCLLHVDAVVALADLLSDRLLSYGDRWGAGSAAERGAAREEVERRMPKGNWLADMFSSSHGRIVRRQDVRALFS
jgi:hypothetical protein